MTATLTALPTIPADAPEPAPAEEPRAQRVTFPLGWLRGLAALAVVWFHAYQNNRTGSAWAWPWTGAAHQLMLGTDLFVDMFFVLSGLVLWLPVARSVIDGLPGRSGRMLLYRRLARLLPLYVTTVMVVWAVTNPVWPGHWQDLLLHLTFTHVYSDTYIFWTDGPAWSLAVEMHFYVLMALAVPLVNALARRSDSRRVRILVVSALPALAAVVSLAYLWWAIDVSGAPITDWSVWFSPLSRGADFGIGMGLAVLSATGLRLGRALRGALAVLGTVALAALVWTRPFDSPTGDWWHPAYSLAIAVAMASIVLHDGPWPAWLSWKPLAWIGSLGYGVYLLHEPVMRFLGWLHLLPAAQPGSWFIVTFALVLVPTLAVAWLSSRTLEAAGLRLLSMIDRDGRPRDYYAHLEE
jgi:peptidoglycan/LPS O-acetylase OafA/YrhL